MTKAGTIQRIRQGKRNVEALFAVAAYESPANRLNALTQGQAARLVMSETGEDVSVVTLAVAMRERGYRPAAKNNGEFVKSLESALRRNGSLARR